MNNPVTWFELATVDLERAKTFYNTVFNRNFEYIEMPDNTKMYMFQLAESGKGGAGALVNSKDNTPSADGTIVYFQSDDVAVEAAKIEKAGGKLLMPKTSIGPFGFIAQFIDTEGNRVGMHSEK